ncbi:MAG: hypothetical protein ACJ74Z_06890 [Bryobacteraceae bacterium]
MIKTRPWNNGVRVPWGMQARMPTKKKFVIKVGTIAVDMYDTAAKKLVRSGTATKTVDATPLMNR